VTNVVPFRADHPAPTFVCADCRAAVFDALGQVRERCLTCQWIADIPDEAERKTLRRWYQEIGQ
jgi:hypothetical protein